EPAAQALQLDRDAALGGAVCVSGRGDIDRTGHSSSSPGRTVPRRRVRLANDSSRSSTAARTSAASDTATDMVALLLPSRLMATRRLVRLSSEAMVNSPRTRATVRKAADSTADRMLGTTTRHITVAQLAPRLRAASASVRTSIADRPASIARYAYGRTRIVYANVSVSEEPLSRYVTQAYTGASPTTRTIAGIVSGSRQ